MNTIPRMLMMIALLFTSQNLLHAQTLDEEFDDFSQWLGEDAALAVFPAIVYAELTKWAFEVRSDLGKVPEELQQAFEDLDEDGDDWYFLFEGDFEEKLNTRVAQGKKEIKDDVMKASSHWEIWGILGTWFSDNFEDYYDNFDDYYE